MTPEDGHIIPGKGDGECMSNHKHIGNSHTSVEKAVVGIETCAWP